MGLPTLQTHADGDLADGTAVYLDDAALYDEAVGNVERGNLKEPYTAIQVFRRDLNATGLVAPEDNWLAGEAVVATDVVGMVAFVTGYDGTPATDFYTLTLEARNIAQESAWETILTMAQVEDVSGNADIYRATNAARSLRAGELWRLRVEETGACLAGAPNATDALHVLIIMREMHQGGRDG